MRMPVRILATVLTLAAGPGWGADALGGPDARKADPLAARVLLPGLSERRATAVLHRVRACTDIAINLEVIRRRGQDETDAPKPITVAAGTHTLGEVLEQLRKATPELSWRPGVDGLDVTLRLDEKGEDMLDSAVGEDREGMMSAEQLVRWLWKAAPGVDLNRAGAYTYPAYPSGAHKVSARKGMTVRDVLDRFCAGAGMFWVVDVQDRADIRAVHMEGPTAPPYKGHGMFDSRMHITFGQKMPAGWIRRPPGVPPKPADPPAAGDAKPAGKAP